MKTHELFAYLHVRDADAAIAFYERAFGARQCLRLTDGKGRVGHAELDLDGHTLMLADELPEEGIHGPQSIGGTSVTLHLHVDDADEVIRRATQAGATIEREPTDQF